MHETMRYIASSVREQYEANPEFESATRADKPKMPAVGRKNRRQRTDKTKKTFATLVGLLCYKHSRLSFSALDVKKSFLILT